MRLAAQAIQTDVAALREALQFARQSADITNRRMHLETAIGLYRGELLPGFYEDWISTERDLLTLAYRRALDELIELLETSGQPAEALSCALKHAAVDPYDEKSYARLMRLYVAAGEPAEALRHYRTLEQRLREDLDEQPSDETRRIAKQLLSVGPTVRPTVGTPASPDASAPPLQSREIRLPLSLTRFFGRESEMERLQELFKQRLITLTGPGGSGKTRLAIRRFSKGYTGRVLFVPLADLSSLT